MPNWVFNGLTIEGNPDSVNKLKEQMNAPFKRVHDSVWDSETKTVIEKEVSYPAPVFAFWNIIKPTDLEAYNKQSDYTLPMTEQLKFAGDNWYDWNVRNWGTKWDVAVSEEDRNPDTYYEEADNGDNKVIYYNFNTAWSPPHPAIAELSKQYPDLLFTLSYEEETGWGGECEFLRGEQISTSEYDSKCRDCDANDTLEYCEYCENEVCSACGFGNEEAEENKCPTHSVESETNVTENREATNV